MGDNKNRLLVFYGLLIIAFLILAGRLFELQVIFGPKNRALAEGNRMRKLVDPAPRGMIYDRQGKPLVRNVPVYRKKVQSEDCFELITREEALKIEAQGGEELDNLRMDIGRDYLYGQTLAHVLGYLGESSQAEVEEGNYQLGDLIGRMGIEEAYDVTLRGHDGGEILEVDSQGNKIREVGKIEPIPGRDLYLSIDAELSQVAFEALEGKKGAVVATETETGQVVVLVSSPSFNSNRINPEVLTDTQEPMFNRAIGGVYPPGSTFKIVTAVAGIEEGKVDRETIYEDTGEIRIGEYVYRNWYFTQYGRTEGKIDLVRAIKRSTDTFFYKVGEWVGATRLAEWAKAFGLGRETGIDINGEARGLVPDPEWKERIKGERWFLGNTYHFAIGQADLLTTPLQINMMTSVIANGGQLCSPRVKGNMDKGTSDGVRLEWSRSHDSSEVISCQDLHLKEKTLQLVKEGMEEVCSEGGTAPPFFDFEPQTACKTGTAEFGDPQDRTHAWLTAFAPVDEPEIVVTALVEAGGEGSDVAAPIVKKVMEAWFKNL
jgi:penicillin-binding protein 2